MKLYINRKPVTMKINYDKKAVWLWCLIKYNKIFKKDFIAITNPITGTIHSLETITPHDSTYEHEKIHVLQSCYHGRLKFLIFYLFYTIKYGYDKNPLEIEAYQNQNTCQCIEKDETIYKK